MNIKNNYPKKSDSKLKSVFIEVISANPLILNEEDLKEYEIQPFLTVKNF